MNRGQPNRADEDPLACLTPHFLSNPETSSLLPFRNSINFPSTHPGFRFLRKSEPANLALLGIIVSSFSKCFLHKAIFEYMVQSARAKKARLAASARLTRMPASTLRPAVHLVASLRSMRANKEKNRGVVPTEHSDVKPITSGNAEHPGKPAMPRQIKPKGRAKEEERIGNVNCDDHPAEEKENAEISVMEVVKFDEERTVT